ncbi:MAG: APC family permease [Chloroflexota bacterium]
MSGRKVGDRRVRVERPHSAYFRYTGPGQLTAKPAANAPKTGLGRAWARVKGVAIGRPLASEEEIGERLSKTKALAIFSSDAISSSTYASEEILRILLLAGGAALALGPEIALGIAGVLLIVAVSYRQVCLAYPSGGGAYAVARANLSQRVALVAAASLLFDYMMTVAVSVAAGIAAITSVVPELLPWRAELGIAAIAILALANLRGLRESGNIFAIPTYLYVVGALAIIGLGLSRIVAGDAAASFAAPVVETPSGGFEALSIFLVLRAFAFGSVALTGTEALSNGVPAFKPPEARNAATTMLAMALLLGVIFVGLSFLSHAYGLAPDPGERETLISQITRSVIGDGAPYVGFQVVTTLILLLAANTGFNGAPRLAQILAADGYAPRQLATLGDRLAFSWGIVALAAASAALLFIFDGSVADLIPLYSIGIFLSFSISQSGMVIHWVQERTPGWTWRAGLNFVGAIITGVVWVVITIAKVPHGAWVALIAIPVLVGLMEWVRAQYRGQEAALHVGADAPIPSPRRTRRVVVPVNGINRAVIQAVNVGRAFGEDVRAVYVTDDPEEGNRLRERWTRQLPDVPFVVVESPYRALIGPFVAYLDVLDRTWAPDREAPTTVVVLPEYVGRHWWDRVLYNQTARRLRAVLVGREHTVILDVPYRRGEGSSGDKGQDGTETGP